MSSLFVLLKIGQTGIQKGENSTHSCLESELIDPDRQSTYCRLTNQNEPLLPREYPFEKPLPTCYFLLRLFLVPRQGKQLSHPPKPSRENNPFQLKLLVQQLKVVLLSKNTRAKVTTNLSAVSRDSIVYEIIELQSQNTEQSKSRLSLGEEIPRVYTFLLPCI